MNGQDINGWFIGFIESQNNTYFFSTNIQSEQRATGSKASDGALSTRIDSSHKYKHLPTLQELTYTPILAVFQKSLLTAIPPQHTVIVICIQTNKPKSHNNLKILSTEQQSQIVANWQM